MAAGAAGARAAEVFATVAKKRDAGPDTKMLHIEIGQLALDNDWPARSVASATPGAGR